jgi:hypothetical protein
MFTRQDKWTVMRRESASAPSADPIGDMSLQIIDACLAGVFFAVPFVMGGRHPLGQLILTALAVVAALAWAIRQSLSPNPSWRPTWAIVLICAGAMLVALQAIPLPQALLEKLSPHSAEVLPLWNPDQSTASSISRWAFISFAPEETRASLVMLVTYGLLFFVTVQRVTMIEDVERLLRWCAVSAVCMAAFGLIQYFAGNGMFFWFYTHPFSNTFDGAKASFTNKNHFANFLALGVGPLIWWLAHVFGRVQGAQNRTFNRDVRGFASRDRSDELKTYLLGLALAVVAFAALMSLSRGGMVVIFLAAAVTTSVCYRATVGAGKFLGILIAACVVIGVALSIFGLDRVGRRLETLTSNAPEQKDLSGGRLAIWSGTVKASADYIRLGSGAGTFQEVYPVYSSDASSNQFEITHAENSYLQDLLETGVVGLGLTLAGIALCCLWCIKGCVGSVRLKICAGAIAGSVAAISAHALVDFVWYVPACMAIMAILAACALRVSQFASGKSGADRPAAMWRLAPIAAALVLLPAGALMIYNRIGPAVAQPYWDQYLLALQHNNTQSPMANDAVSTSNRKAIDAAVQREKYLISLLEKTVFWHPAHAQAHLALAEAHLRLFDAMQATSVNPMPLVNIRDAALNSVFNSPDSMHAWLARAVGDHWIHLQSALSHAKKTISLCPLQGRGYICLAKLSFLEGKAGLSKQACVAQAVHVRPFDGVVLYAAAAEALLTGDNQKWLALAKRASSSGREYKGQIIVDLVANTPAEGIQGMIDFIVDQFQPDLECLQMLNAVCSKRLGPEQLVPLWRHLALRAEAEASNNNDPDTAGIWLQAQHFYALLKNGSKALECARRASQCDQNNYAVRYQLALCLLDQGLYAEAESHLHWCLKRNNSDQMLQNKLKEAIGGRLEAQRHAAAQKNDHF